MFYRQYELQSGDEHLTCWLKEAPAVKIGSRLTLKHQPDQWWIVRAIFGPRQPLPPNQFWKVGGLA